MALAVLAHYASGEALGEGSVLFAAITEKGDATDEYEAIRASGDAMPISVVKRLVAADTVLHGLGYVAVDGMRADGTLISTVYVRRGSTAHANGILGFREAAK